MSQPAARYVRPQYTVQDAAKRLSKTRFHRFRFKKTIEPIRIELVYIPHYVITIPVYQGENESSASAAIEACSGAFNLRRYNDELISATRPAPGESFPPRISQDDALDLARDGILKNALRERGGRRTFRWADPTSVDLLQHPFWVYYHARRRGLLDIRLLDAVTGDQPGSKTKAGVLEAFIQAGRNQTEPEPSS